MVRLLAVAADMMTSRKVTRGGKEREREKRRRGDLRLQSGASEWRESAQRERERSEGASGGRRTGMCAAAAAAAVVCCRCSLAAPTAVPAHLACDLSAIARTTLCRQFTDPDIRVRRRDSLSLMRDPGPRLLSLPHFPPPVLRLESHSLTRARSTCCASLRALSLSRLRGREREEGNATRALTQ